MSALARILFDCGLLVSGCEARESITVWSAQEHSADIVIGHLHLDDTDPFVFMTAINPDTLLRWHRAGFRVFWKAKSRPSPTPAAPRGDPSS